jgi:hypothetical protein
LLREGAERSGVQVVQLQGTATERKERVRHS